MQTYGTAREVTDDIIIRRTQMMYLIISYVLMVLVFFRDSFEPIYVTEKPDICKCTSIVINDAW